jgi:hypothetical protein
VVVVAICADVEMDHDGETRVEEIMILPRRYSHSYNHIHLRWTMPRRFTEFI